MSPENDVVTAEHSLPNDGACGYNCLNAMGPQRASPALGPPCTQSPRPTPRPCSSTPQPSSLQGDRAVEDESRIESLVNRVNGLEELISECFSVNASLKKSFERLQADVQNGISDTAGPQDSGVFASPRTCGIDIDDAAIGIEINIDDAPKETKRKSVNETMDHGIEMNRRGSWNDVEQHRWQATLQDQQATDDIGIDTWNFRKSCWDAAAFLGDSEVQLFGESIIIFFMVVLNIIMQGGFIIVVAMSLAKTSLDDEAIDGYHWWRTNIAHSVQFTDPMTEMSLGSRVCAQDSSLHLSNTQLGQVQDIEAYLYENTPFNGPLMCALALITWILTASKELYVLKQMVASLLRVPRGVTEIVVEGVQLTLMSIGTCRLYFIFTLCFLRATIACSLLVFGLKYLAVTISIEDILLNAVALEFVMNVDELLYAAMAPIKTRRLVACLKPLTTGDVFTYGGVDIHVLFAILFTFGFFGAAVPLWLMPEVDNMVRAKAELCGGFKSFSYTYSAGGFVAWAKETSDSPEDVREQLRLSSRYRIIRDVVDGTSNEITKNTQLSDLAGPGWSAFSVNAWSIADVGMQINPFCEDLLPSNVSNRPRDPFSFMAETALRDAIGDQSISSCNVGRHCGAYTASGSVARSMCARTCSCDVPKSSQFLPYPAEGCPQACLNELYQQKIDKAPCVDVAVTDERWVAVVTSLYTASRSWFGDFPEAFAWMADVLSKLGCSGLAHVEKEAGTNLCHTRSISKALALFCPVSCKCKDNSRYGCPTTC